MSTYLVEPQEPQMTSQYGAEESRAGYASLHARTQFHTHTLPGTFTQARARAHTHTQLCNTAFPRQPWLHERALVLRFTYITCLVLFNNGSMFCHICTLNPILSSFCDLHFLLQLIPCLSRRCDLSLIIYTFLRNYYIIS